MTSSISRHTPFLAEMPPSLPTEALDPNGSSQSISPKIALMLMKTLFVDRAGVGIREIARRSRIKRRRLEKLFAGEVEPTADELISLNRVGDVLQRRLIPSAK